VHAILQATLIEVDEETNGFLGEPEIGQDLLLVDALDRLN
jgi:hypothetical protein